MTIKELIKKLNCFDPEHEVEIEFMHSSGCVCSGSDILDVEYKRGKCFLIGNEDNEK